jgi:hypothetical protein
LKDVIYAIAQRGFDDEENCVLYQSNEKIKDLYYKDGSLYFIQEDSGTSDNILLRFNVADKKTERVTKESVGGYYIEKNTIYYYTLQDNTNIVKKIYFDGTIEQVDGIEWKGQTNVFLVEGNSIYHTEENDNDALYKFDIITHDDCIISGTDSVEGINIHDNMVFYSGSNGDIIKYDHEDNSSKTIATMGGTQASFSIAGDKIYYYEDIEKNESGWKDVTLYSIDIDSGKKEIVASVEAE